MPRPLFLLAPTRALPILLTAALLAGAVGLAGCRSAGSAAGERASAGAGPPAAGMALPPDYAYPDRDTVRIATWNVENFVDGHDNPYIDSDREDDPSPARADREDRLVRGLRQMNADVVVLQEFESEAYLEHLAETRLPESGYRFFASTESPDWHQNVVVASRYPLGMLTGFADAVTPIEGQRADNGAPAATSLINHRLYTIGVRVRPEASWTLVGAHLKAGGSARDVGWRLGQISLLHQQLADLQALRPDAPVLVAGDLNSTADSPELRLLLNDPDRPAPDSLRDRTGAWTARLSDPLAGRATPTFPSDDPSRQLDYLLPNRVLMDRLVEGSVRIATPLPRRAMQRTSDHLPVVGTFRIDR
jgi:endonuclease/exonuclease/phosphatase family metal-dependent hydrolase